MNMLAVKMLALKTHLDGMAFWTIHFRDDRRIRPVRCETVRHRLLCRRNQRLLQQV